MTPSPEHNAKIAKLTFAQVYPLYVAKVERKGRTEAELRQVIEWLTGFDWPHQQALIAEKVNFEVFFDRAQLHPNAILIKGLICGYRIEELENELTRNVRYLDKLVDELAKGKAMEKILRAWKSSRCWRVRAMGLKLPRLTCVCAGLVMCWGLRKAVLRS